MKTLTTASLILWLTLCCLAPAATQNFGQIQLNNSDITYDTVTTVWNFSRITIDTDNANALLVETSGGTDVLKVDTVTPTVTLYQPTVTDYTNATHDHTNAAAGGTVSHADLTSVDANEHIDHTTVTITAGDALTGGGTIAANRTIDFDIDSLSEDGTPGSTDWVIIEQSGGGTFNKVQVGNLPTSGGGEANTYSNSGVGGVGVILTKAGIDLPFKSINVGSAKITVTNDAVNNEVDIDFGSVALADLSDVSATEGTGSTVLFKGSPVITTPFLSSFINSQHDHTTAAEGGALSTSAVTSGTFADARIAQSNVTQHEAAINHDALTNFVANEHIDHSGVTLTAGAGLTGGGTIAASRSFDVGGGTGISVAADSISTNDSQIVHDNLFGFVANEHIDHSGVTLTAGDGLSGGGTITASRTFDVDIFSEATDATPLGTDWILIENVTGGVINKIQLQNIPSLGGVTDHGALTGLVPDDDHTQYAYLSGRDNDALAIDQVQAYDSAGLKLYEDGGAGLFIEDGTGDVGHGTTTPGFSAGGGIEIENSAQASLRLEKTGAYANIYDTACSGLGNYVIYDATVGAERLVIAKTSGNVAIGGGTATGTLASGLLLKHGVAASASTTDIVQLFADDAGSAGAGHMGLHMRGEDDANNLIVTGYDEQSGTSDSGPTAAAQPGAIVKYNDTDDDTGDGIYILGEDGTTWNQLDETGGGGGDFSDGGDTASATRVLGNNNAYDMDLETNNTVRINIDSGGNVDFPTKNLLINTPSPSTVMDGGIAIAQGTAPDSSPSDTVQLWCANAQSIAGAATLYMRTERDEGKQVSGFGTETANAESPTAGNWTPGDIVEFTDGGDGSGDGLYFLRADGSTWYQIADFSGP